MKNEIKFVKDTNSIFLHVHQNKDVIGVLMVAPDRRWYFCSGYYYEPITWMNAEDFRVIAEKLDELNNE